MFVASDNDINVHGINWFVEEVLPDLRAKHPAAEVWLVGTVANKIGEQAGVKRLGRVDDLSEVYGKAHLVINPVRFNTGLSIKNLEALAFSCPLVTAPVGTEGLEQGINVAYLVADKPNEFVDAIGQILTDDSTATRLSVAARNLAESWNETALEQLNRALEGQGKAQ
ncbi:MAG: glycosyltransferase [Rhodothermales bacterium]|nr:glycosyltransferase [Rhodothermales bacterium]